MMEGCWKENDEIFPEARRDEIVVVVVGGYKMWI